MEELHRSPYVGLCGTHGTVDMIERYFYWLRGGGGGGGNNTNGTSNNKDTSSDSGSDSGIDKKDHPITSTFPTAPKNLKLSVEVFPTKGFGLKIVQHLPKTMGLD